MYFTEPFYGGFSVVIWKEHGLWTSRQFFGPLVFFFFFLEKGESIMFAQPIAKVVKKKKKKVESVSC